MASFLRLFISRCTDKIIQIYIYMLFFGTFNIFFSFFTIKNGIEFFIVSTLCIVVKAASFQDAESVKCCQ